MLIINLILYIYIYISSPKIYTDLMHVNMHV